MTPTTTRSRGPVFPPEIFDTVIDQVYALSKEDDHDDGDRVKDKPLKVILGVCSLVCRSWLPRSRRYLFEFVVIEGDDPRGLDSLRPFLALLDSPLCTIKPYVQILELDDIRGVANALPLFSALTQVRSASEMWIFLCHCRRGVSVAFRICSFWCS
jgi:hypothetical protein